MAKGNTIAKGDLQRCKVSILGQQFNGAILKKHRVGSKLFGFGYKYDMALYNADNPKEATERMFIDGVHQKHVTFL